MNDLVFEALTTIVALACGAAWYKEFIQRRKIEADLAVEKQMRKLDDTQNKLDSNKEKYDQLLGSLASHRVPDYMLERLRSRSEASETAGSTGRSGTEGGPEGGGEGVH